MDIEENDPEIKVYIHTPTSDRPDNPIHRPRLEVGRVPVDLLSYIQTGSIDIPFVSPSVLDFSSNSMFDRIFDPYVENNHINENVCLNLEWKTGLENGEQCIICLHSFKKEEHYCVTHCNHFFHFSCLSEWVKRNPICPTCRAEISVYENLD